MKTNRVILLVLALLGVTLVQNAQAFYNPSTGRWLSRDPIGEKSFYGNYLLGISYGQRLELESRRTDFEMASYSFVRNSPLTWIDLDGGRDTPGGDIPIDKTNRRTAPTGMDLIKVKPCTILILYGHNWEGPDKFNIGGFQNVWNIVASDDKDPKGCAYAGVITCNAYNVPNEIPLPGYVPVRGILPIKDRSADDDLGRQLVEAMKAAEESAKGCCNNCGCKQIKIKVESYGLTIGERLTFPTLNDKTIKCPKKIEGNK